LGVWVFGVWGEESGWSEKEGGKKRKKVGRRRRKEKKTFFLSFLSLPLSLHSGTSTQVPAARDSANIDNTIAAEVTAARSTNAAVVAPFLLFWPPLLSLALSRERRALLAAERCIAWNAAPIRPPTAATSASRGSCCVHSKAESGATPANLKTPKALG
jgi:hypothetical protein